MTNASHIVKLTNACINLSVWPSYFKDSTSVIIPKLLKLSYDSPKSFHPIVLLNTLGKLIEKVIGLHMQVHTIVNGYICYCYDSPWTGLLTSGDGSCHWWTAVGVRVTPLGRCNNNRTTWEQSCQVLDMDIQHLDTRHMLADRHGKYIDNNRVPSRIWYLVDLLYK